MILTKRTTSFLFLFVVFFVISFSFVEADRTIRIRKAKTHLAPKHIALSARSGSGVYARRYSYGRPIPNYNTKPTFGRIRRNFKGGRRTRKRENGSRTYASGYRNWTPNRNSLGGRNNPRIDYPRIGAYKKRKESYPLVKDYPHYGSPKQKRRIRPNRFNPVQRPLKHQNDFEDEYYFSDEAKRGEKYEFESRYPRPKKKRRNPSGVEKIPKKPELISKIPYYDDNPFKSNTRDTPVSFSTFIQHPSSTRDEIDDAYEDSEVEGYSKPKNKKKRVKKKTTSSKKKKKKDELYYQPFVFEKDTKPDIFSPYGDEYELPVKTTKKTNKLKHSYDDDFAPNTHYTKTKHGSSLFGSSDAEYDYRGSSKGQDSSHFSPSYSPSWSSVVETTARPVQYQTEHGFQPQSSGVYNYQNRDYSASQKTKTVTTNTQQSSYYSQPDNTYKNTAYSNSYVGNQPTNSQTNSQSSSTNYNYHAYSQPTVYSNQASPTVYSNQPTYSQPVPSSSTFLTDVTVQKSVPIYDNTETFYSFNNNAYVNNQASKYYEPDNQKYLLSSVYRNNNKEKNDDEFIKKHQNLYNNGLSGVPVQGDGFGKENLKKDFDIGYGDFQFDENPAT